MITEHKTICRKDVAWMFQQWDGNNDGELSMKELAPLEEDLKEKCLKAYIDRCGICYASFLYVIFTLHKLRHSLNYGHNRLCFFGIKDIIFL